MLYKCTWFRTWCSLPNTVYFTIQYGRKYRLRQRTRYSFWANAAHFEFQWCTLYSDWFYVVVQKCQIPRKKLQNMIIFEIISSAEQQKTQLKYTYNSRWQWFRATFIYLTYEVVVKYKGSLGGSLGMKWMRLRRAYLTYEVVVKYKGCLGWQLGNKMDEAA